MTIKNIFDQEGADSLRSRIMQLQPDSKPAWGKMSVSQMLAHCCVPFETIFDPEYAVKNPRPNAVVRFVLRAFVKGFVVGPKPYKRNLRTPPEFLISDPRDFEKERTRLIGFIDQTFATGGAAFDGKESHSFGPLTTDEWNMLFYKHTDHHLEQFGV